MIEVRFDHLVRLTDGTGLLEHSRLAVPRRQYGYTTDDNARALIAVCRASEPDDELQRLADIYLAFLQLAQRRDGKFRNRLSYARTWKDRTDTDDASGRAVWSLATAVARSPWPWIGATARDLLARSSTFRSPHLRANCFALLGGCEVLVARPDDAVGWTLLERCAPALPQLPADPEWPWPEPVLRYDNARIAEAFLAVGDVTADSRLVAQGLEMLRWLVDAQTSGGVLSTVSHLGWRRGEPRPRFDQQPIEAAAIADAAYRAWTMTSDSIWAEVVDRAAGWFLGENDLGVEMFDAHTGGSYDGLTPVGPNLNQGAESAIAMITTLQRAQEVRTMPVPRAEPLARPEPPLHTGRPLRT